MARSLVARKPNARNRTKVKTGCTTCRIRKIKCDESKPFCRKCVGTGRTCDGYQSPFRFITSRPANKPQAGGNLCLGESSYYGILPTLIELDPREIDLLNRHFSTKTLFGIKLGCDEEAKQALQASLTDPSVRHALSSLKALREDLETSGDVPASVAQQTPAYNHGLQQYCAALGGLASKLSSPSSPNRLKSALLCCQIFISIEQVRMNYNSMAQHIIQGLRIMHEHCARPSLDAADKLVPARHNQLPFLDVFVIKLFAAPCKFVEPPPSADTSSTLASPSASACPVSTPQQPVKTRDLRLIAPNMRTELTRIATSTLEFLDNVTHVKSTVDALRLLSEKASLLNSLESWLIDLELVQAEVDSPDNKPISASFLRFFHQILKLVLLETLDSSPDLDVQLQKEDERLRGIASNVTERVRGYNMRSATRSGQGERSTEP